MKVCIVAEGCYPYVVGGVSGWINSLIKSFPNVEFILLAIVANRSFRGKFVYELPENLTQVYEVYLEDSEWEGGNRKRKSRKKVHLSHKEYDELLNMVLNRKTDWGIIFDRSPAAMFVETARNRSLLWQQKKQNFPIFLIAGL